MTLVVIALVAFIAFREWMAHNERSRMLVRIQAPQVAVAKDAEETHELRPPARTVSPLDDAGFRRAKGIEDDA